jgi:hypothetical protein
LGEIYEIALAIMKPDGDQPFLLLPQQEEFRVAASLWHPTTTSV